MTVRSYFGIADGKHKNTDTTLRRPAGAALIAAPIAVAATAALLIPTPAAAATDSLTLTGDCTGSVVGTYPIGNGAQVQVTWDGRDNCVKTVDVTGKNSRTYLKVWATTVGRGDFNSDEGLFKQHAGPIRLKRTAGHCISFGGAATGTQSAAGAKSASWNSVHCG
ncbi:hypothetical protein [Streptomyces sp. NPDC058247]|uniref:hypothetical protein n=1 Tax=Streptomyces sp. NPDC058247 TaxID=3346401 RepID=UPI0036EE3644